MKNYNKVHKKENLVEGPFEMTDTKEAPKNRVQVLVKKLNVRSKPDIESPVLDIISEGKKLLMVNAEVPSDEWTSVLIHDGVKGFVMSEFVERVD